MMQIEWQTIVNEMRTKLLEGDSEAALALARRVIGQGVAPADFFAEAITPAMVLDVAENQLKTRRSPCG